MPHPEHGACVHSSRVIGPSTIGAVAEYGCRRMRDAAPWSVRAGSRPYPRCALREGAPHDSYLCAAPRQMGSGPDLDITVAATALCSGGVRALVQMASQWSWLFLCPVKGEMRPCPSCKDVSRAGIGRTKEQSGPVVHA